MNALLIDDEKQARDAMAGLLKLYCPNVHLLGQAENGESGLELIKSLRPDLVFLDIDMPDIDGFEVVRRLERVDFALVFVTASNNYAVRAFELSALDYLVKPVEPSRLIHSVHKAVERNRLRGSMAQYQLLMELINLQNTTGTLDHRIVFATHSEIVFSWLRNLIWIDADMNFCYVKLADQPEPLRIAKNIGEYEKLLDGYEHLMRVHRSHLVNLFHVKKYLRDDGVLLMTDNLRVPVVGNRRDEVLRRLHALGVMV